MAADLFLDGVRKGRPGGEADVGAAGLIFMLSSTGLIAMTREPSCFGGQEQRV